MAPPVSYFNTPWGKRNSDFEEARSRRSFSSCSISTFSSAPAHRQESPSQSRSPSPKRGSIADLPASRTNALRAYAKVVQTAQVQGFAPPSQESVKHYSTRALPPTPTSAKSVAEMTLPRSSSPSSFPVGKKLNPSPSLPATDSTRTHTLIHRRRLAPLYPPPRTRTSIISAQELTTPGGRVHGIAALHRNHQPPTSQQLVCAADLQDLLDSPTLGAGVGAVVVDGRVFFFWTVRLPLRLLLGRVRGRRWIVSFRPRLDLRVRVRARWRWTGGFRRGSCACRSGRSGR